MLITHLALFSFYDGASEATPPVLEGMGGSLSLPPFFVFDGLSSESTGVVVYAGVTTRYYRGISKPNRLSHYVSYYDTDPAIDD